MDPAATDTPPTPNAALVLSPKLSSAVPLNCASRATIAFLESDRPDAPRAGDAYGDEAQARAVRF